jgi:predicted small lipoprotein YifL
VLDVDRLARLFLTLAAIAALASLLTACGLRGSLDLPPDAPPPQTQVDGQRTTTPPTPEEETQARSPRKRIFLDWLLD